MTKQVTEQVAPYAVPSIEWWIANPDADWVATDYGGRVYKYRGVKPTPSKKSWIWMSMLPDWQEAEELCTGKGLCPDWEASLIERPRGQIEVYERSLLPDEDAILDEQMREEVPVHVNCRCATAEAPAPFIRSGYLNRAEDLTGHAEDGIGNAAELGTLYATIALAEAVERLVHLLGTKGVR
jgi:hypothetical protein